MLSGEATKRVGGTATALVNPVAKDKKLGPAPVGRKARRIGVESCMEGTNGGL